MKSDIYTGKQGIASILSEVDKIGRFCNLSPSGTGKLRLLAEEMLGLTVRLFDDLEYEFYIENEGKSFSLNLRADTFVNSKQKERMISLSSRSENKADKGIFGKISGIFENLLMDDEEHEQIYIPYIPNYDMIGMVCYFSLSAYQNDIPKTTKEEQWDGLEKSIIANLAKDIIIGVRNNKVEMIVIIEF